MLYLLEPPANLKWVDFPATLARSAVSEHDAELGNLEWRSDTDRAVTDDTVRVALRHGMKCSRGLVVEAIHLIELDRANELRRIAREIEEAQHNLAANDQLMEQLMPGWIESGQMLQASIDESVENSIREAEQEARVLLDAPESAGLLAHWESMGGHLP